MCIRLSIRVYTLYKPDRMLFWAMGTLCFGPIADRLALFRTVGAGTPSAFGRGYLVLNTTFK